MALLLFLLGFVVWSVGFLCVILFVLEGFVSFCF